MNQEDGKKEIFKTTNGLLLSLTTVLIQEMEKFNRLIDVISKSLDTLKEAIYGFVVMSDVLDKMFVKLQNG
jgi:dynein heavy chain